MKAFIQNEADSFVKHFHDEKTLELKSSSQMSRAYPFPYGFILNTTAPDGLNVDCFVLTRTHLATGQTVECELAGLMEQIEDGKEDHNVLLTLPGEGYKIDATTRNILVEFVSHVFDHIDGKFIQAGAFLGQQAALGYIKRHQDGQ